MIYDGIGTIIGSSNQTYIERGLRTVQTSARNLEKQNEWTKVPSIFQCDPLCNQVETLDKFVGVVQSRDHRKPECSGYGENSRVTLLRINLLADTHDPDYCGVFVNQVMYILSVVSSLLHCFIFQSLSFGTPMHKKPWTWNTCNNAKFRKWHFRNTNVSYELLKEILVNALERKYG